MPVTINTVYWLVDSIKNMLIDKGCIVALYNNSEKVAELQMTVETYGAQVLVHAEDNSANEYVFNKLVIETSTGVPLFIWNSEVKQKTNLNRVIVDWVIPVGGA